MAASFSGSLAVFLALLSSNIAAGTSCEKFTLSNALDLGKCLKSAGDLCANSSDAITDFAGKLVPCVLSGIGSLNVGSQMKLVEELAILAAHRVAPKYGLDYLTDSLYLFCKFTFATPYECNRVVIGSGNVCSDPVTISLPSTLKIGQCLNGQTSVCQKGKPVTGDVLGSFFKFVTCFVQGVFGTIPGDSANGPACAVIKFLSSFTRYLGQAGIDYREPLPKALASLKCK